MTFSLSRDELEALGYSQAAIDYILMPRQLGKTVTVKVGTLWLTGEVLWHDPRPHPWGGAAIHPPHADCHFLFCEETVWLTGEEWPHYPGWPDGDRAQETP